MHWEWGGEPGDGGGREGLQWRQEVLVIPRAGTIKSPSKHASVGTSVTSSTGGDVGPVLFVPAGTGECSVPQWHPGESPGVVSVSLGLLPQQEASYLCTRLIIYAQGQAQPVTLDH